MAVADLIKLIPEPSIRGQSHVLGLLSVLAISGSVALLTLSCKLKLSSTADAIEEDEEEDQEHESDGWDGRNNRRASRSGASSEASEMEGRDSDGKKKRVHFAEDVREPRGDGREYRLRVCGERREDGSRRTSNQMPANRMALYRGLRQSRLQLAACFSS